MAQPQHNLQGKGKVAETYLAYMETRAEALWTVTGITSKVSQKHCCGTAPNQRGDVVEIVALTTRHGITGDLRTVFPQQSLRYWLDMAEELTLGDEIIAGSKKALRVGIGALALPIIPSCWRAQAGGSAPAQTAS